MTIFTKSYSFDDVLLTPKYSTIDSRKNVSTKVKIKDYTFETPIIPANMKSIASPELITMQLSIGGLALDHRFLPLHKRYEYVSSLSNKTNFGVSIGLSKEDYDSVTEFYNLGIRIFCIDVAHGHCKRNIDMISYIKNIDKSILLISGNVCTFDGTLDLLKAGADIIKVGIGGGSLCTTRIETGNGIPQLSALIESKNALRHFEKNNKKGYLISDGGLKSAGDIVKALCFADMVMAGSLFAGCKEVASPSSKDGFSLYEGSSTHKNNHIEGVKALVKNKGPFIDIHQSLIEGIKSGCSYQGCSSIDELQISPKFVEITTAGLQESKPHIQGIIN